jgi:hypothetical protein
MGQGCRLLVDSMYATLLQAAHEHGKQAATWIAAVAPRGRVAPVGVLVPWCYNRLMCWQQLRAHMPAASNGAKAGDVSVICFGRAACMLLPMLWSSNAVPFFLSPLGRLLVDGRATWAWRMLALKAYLCA